jgi:hypothetical protein
MRLGSEPPESAEIAGGSGRGFYRAGSRRRLAMVDAERGGGRCAAGRMRTRKAKLGGSGCACFAVLPLCKFVFKTPPRVVCWFGQPIDSSWVRALPAMGNLGFRMEFTIQNLNTYIRVEVGRSPNQPSTQELRNKKKLAHKKKPLPSSKCVKSRHAVVSLQSKLTKQY